MTADAYNPDDLAFLLSRGLDGDLSPDEQRRLGESLSQSESLRAEASKLEAVDREKLEVYQRRYQEYVRTAKALQALST